MPLSKRIFLGDEELGKKDDDHNRGNSQSKLLTQWPRRLARRRRALLAIVVICLIYFMFFRQPPPETPELDEISAPVPDTSSPLSEPDTAPEGPPPVPDDGLPEADRYYSGPVKFHALAGSLYSVDGVRGYRREQKIVVFAVAELKSLSDLLPVACEMAAKRLNRVHFALMGRDEVSIETIQDIHNVNQTECPMVWHDARPEYGPWSTDAHMEASVKAGLGHISMTLRPPVIVTRDESEEEPFFMRGIKRGAAKGFMTHISLPTRAADCRWITDLDAFSLSVWNEIDVEVLLHASPGSAGSFIRLLKSLQKADYFGPAPGLTIELPVDADPFLLGFLRDFQWPPNSQGGELTLRRQINPHTNTPQEATISTLNGFYPKDPALSHVLLLSSQTELAPSFYHFLKYTILKYKYSRSTQSRVRRLLGISLELPMSRPTDGEHFSAPETPPIPKTRMDEIPAFLWQAPNSNAALYFGDKWVEFQSFLFNRFAPSLGAKQQKRPKLLSKTFPAWMEYMLEFIRARGYLLLYPTFASQDEFALSKLHHEPYHPPEEYRSESDSGHVGKKQNFVEKDLSDSSTISDLLDAFPNYLPDLFSLEDLPYTGEVTTDGLIERTETFRKAFRRDIGGCLQGGKSPEFAPLKADDLFCLEEEEVGGFPSLGDVV